MMCDTTNNRSLFRSQLGAILEKLTKAVLVDVSNLADECSSALHVEISQHRSENEALKKKCFSLEIQLRAARGSSAAAAAAASHNNYPTTTTTNTSSSSSNHVSHRNTGPAAGGSEKFVRDQQQPAAAAAPAIDGIFGKDWCMDLWRGEKLPPASKGTEVASTLRTNGPPVPPPPQAVDLMDGEPDLIFVKEEMYEDQPIGQQMRLSDNGKRGATIEEDGTDQGAVSDLRLHQGALNNFPVTSAQPQQGTPPILMDSLIEGSTMGNLVDDANRSTASGEYSDYMNNMQMNATKELANQHRAGKAPKQFECLFCGKVFNYLSSLKVHIRRHSGEKPFSCTVCGKRFAQKTYLKLHQRVHSGEKPYSCLECGRSFSQKSSLNMHLRTHTGEKPYSCVDCGKSYAYKYGFNQHKCFN